MSSVPLGKVVCGNCLDVMREWPAESIDMVMFSPPYWGLRDYGEQTATVWGGNPNCKHEWGEEKSTLVHDDKLAGFCIKCGAWRGQLGLEPSWQMYVEHMVSICRQIKRVLKKTGSMYIVLGDTFFGGGHGYYKYYRVRGKLVRDPKYGERRNACPDRHKLWKELAKATNYKPKCLIGIPWRVAFALIEDGWILRNDIIWHKPNAMPSSVKDRLTQTYEHIFHFVKARRYYYNLDAIREPHKTAFAPFNLRVRDVKRGKGGISAFGKLRASNSEIESYIYPESGKFRRLIQYCLTEYEKTTKIRMTYNHKGGKSAPTSFKSASDWNRGTRETMNKIIDSLDVDEKVKSKLRTWWHDHQGHPKGKNPGDIILTKHDIAVRRFPTVNRKGGLGYTDPLHMKAYNKKEKNPGDVVKVPYSVQPRLKDSVEVRNLPPMGELKDYLNKWRKKRGYTIKQVEAELKSQAPHHWFSGESYPTKEDWLRIKKLLQFDEKYDNQMMKVFLKPAKKQNHPKGKNPGDFWSICTKPFKGAHFAVYPEEICVRPIKSSCPPDGVVLDPMCGSGTTLVVAKKLGRRFVGIEINPQYCEMARKRLSAIPEKLTRFL